ncbi:MAG: hypothetical protein J3R72DRAFT_434156 [Linnemannia gamsii]|nr:MAG: hypothetical protein J3R72DRAFT_434156 [Linnemannia gamsii]
MSPASGQANHARTPSLPSTVPTQRPNYGSLTHLNQPAPSAVALSKTAANAPSPASSLKSRRDPSAAGAGTGTGTGAGTGGVRTTATSHRSVHIAVPEQDDEHLRGGDDDTSSISSQSSYSTYSSSTGSLEGLDHHHYKGAGETAHGAGGGGGGGGDACEGEEPSSRHMFWTYVGLTPLLLSILVLFAVLLQFLPSSTESEGGYIIHWDRFAQGVIGWTIAFAARTPLFALFSKTLSHRHHNHNTYNNFNQQELDLYLCEWSTLLSAGALEEIIRLGFILFLGIGADFGAVYWLGLGWAGVETLYYIGQSLVYTRWLASDDDDRTAAGGGVIVAAAASGVGAGAVTVPTVTTALLASSTTNATGAGGPSNSHPPTTLETGGDSYTYRNGRNNTLPPTSTKHLLDQNNDDYNEEDIVPTREARHLLGLDRPWWSLMGRTSSMMVHIGLCCWLGHSGWRLLLPAAAVHGSLYVIWGVLMPDQWSVPATSYGTWIAALGVFLIGLALYGEIV